MSIMPYTPNPPCRGMFKDAYKYCRNHPDQYLEHLKRTGLEIQKIARQILLDYLPEETWENSCVMVTGSDARYEKDSSLSPLELIVFHQGGPNPSLDERIRDIVSRFDIFDNRVEVKFSEEVGKEYLKYSPGAGKGKVIPSRILDSIFLVGNESAFQECKSLIPRGIQLLSSKDINSFATDFLSKPKRALKGMRETAEVATQKGLKYISLPYERKSYALATKYTHLRVLQYTIVQRLAAIVRNKKHENYELVKGILPQLPSGIRERLHFLYEKGILKITQEQLEDLIWAYNLSLMTYIGAQWASRFMNVTTHEVPIKLKDFKKASKIIDEFSENRDIWALALPKK